jgi:hypothetical protein
MFAMRPEQIVDVPRRPQGQKSHSSEKNQRCRVSANIQREAPNETPRNAIAAARLRSIWTSPPHYENTDHTEALR